MHVDYTWSVMYRDGTTVDEKTLQNFTSVKQLEVQNIILYSDCGDAHSVQIPEGATALFFRRKALIFDPNVNEQETRLQACCVGWRKGQEAVYLFVFPDGSTFLTSNIDAI